MVLVRERRAEERHDAVAHDLVDGALVPVNGLHHAFEDRIEQLARLLGVAVGKQFHRALEVGEEHGHLLALAFQRGLRGEDSLGEVLWRVGLGEGITKTHSRPHVSKRQPVLGGAVQDVEVPPHVSDSIRLDRCPGERTFRG
jgi:hypothetical protein